MRRFILSLTPAVILLITSIIPSEARPGNHKQQHIYGLLRDVTDARERSTISAIDVPYARQCAPNHTPAHPVADRDLDDETCQQNPNVSSNDILGGSEPQTKSKTSNHHARLELREVNHGRVHTKHAWAHKIAVPATASSTSESNTISVTRKSKTTAAASSQIANNEARDAEVTVDPITASSESVSSSLSSSVANPFAGGYQSFVLTFVGQNPASEVSSLATEVPSSSSTTPKPSSPSSTPTTAPLCPARNGTTYTSEDEITYQIICDIDYPEVDLPFQLVDTFEDCLAACDGFNIENTGSTKCLAALFVPSRVNDEDDCYLKPSIDHPAQATVGIEGAIRVPASTPTISRNPSAKSSTKVSSTSITSATATAVSGSEPGVTYASGKKVIAPKVSSSNLHGPVVNKPTNQFINKPSPHVEKLDSDLLVVGVNTDLSTDYPISPNTGVLQVNISTQPYLDVLSNQVHLSRDGGRGGHLNGQHIFVFCDTGSYSTTTSAKNGDFLGFVSSSVAVDTGMNALNGDPIYLKDGIGQWNDEAGRMRGLAPLTTGELEYNLKMQGKGQRYAVWPESSIIPLDATTGLIYAPIIYDEVNMDTREAKFTYTGATLLQITAGDKGGPAAKRVTDVIFKRDEVEWGCAGGIRSWGPSGIGGDDGSVYIFGGVSKGMLLARTTPEAVADRDSYEYWDGKSWTSEILPTSSNAFVLDGPFMDIDVFYSPRHLTFIAVYLTAYADSTFYYRYLKAPQAILPPYHEGGNPDVDYVENILKYEWSEEKVLYKASHGLSGKYIYSGGVHTGYFGASDITNGGPRMLLSWTAPTGKDPATLVSEYQIVTAEVTWA